MINLAISTQRAAYLIGFIAATAASAAPVQLKPLSRWDVHYADESCQLMRGFGTAPNNVTMLFEQYQPGDSGSLTLAGKPLRSDSSFSDVRAWFGATRSDKAITAMNGTIGATRVPLVLVPTINVLTIGHEGPNAPSALLDAEAAGIDRLSFEMRDRLLFVLLTGPMDKPFAAMRACTDQLVTTWGVDPATLRHARHLAEPLKPPSSWIGDDDFPNKPLVEGANGLVHFRLMIGADGVPTGCVIQSRTKPDEFAPTACRLLMQRARFAPALDAAGKAVASYFVSSVRFIHEQP